MISKQEKSEALEKILKSPEFSSSERYSSLLKYLFKASIEGNYIKEITIASDLFPQSAHNLQSENAIVRVYISNLRKKLNNYYLSSGMKDNIRLRIPKGHYRLEFYRHDMERQSAIAKLKKLYYPISLFLIVLLLLFTLYFWNKSRTDSSNQMIGRDNPIWIEFLNSDVSTLIAVGDYFFIYKKSPDSSRRIFIRDTRINSDQDFERYLQEYLDNNEKVSKLEFTYLTKSSVIALGELFPLLNSSTNKKIIKMSSELDWTDMENNNVIYIGNFKCLYILQSLLFKLQFQYNTSVPFRLYLMSNKGGITKTYEAIPSTDQAERDYAVICKIRGPRNNSIMLIIGSDEIGIIEALRQVLNPDFVTQIKNNFPKKEMPRHLYFRMILQAEGLQRTGFQSKILFFEDLSDKVWPMTLK